MSDPKSDSSRDPHSHSDSPSRGDREPNRLAGESSPYLLLHQRNPVDWYPWGEEALERARSEDKPIFLSVGYSTCYWCHVMERESFSDQGIAGYMNENFVNIKVDREERPDLDEIYMTATQVLSGQGGWPNSVFLTSDLKPFYAGTYFPPDDRWGRPGFSTLLAGLSEAWKKRRTEVRQQADEVAQAMERILEGRVTPGEEPAPAEAVLAAYRSLVQTFDGDQGGFGRAPKFPSPANLFLLQELAARETPEAPEAGPMLTATLGAMARGGIYDQLGGGFHRYATDSEWKIPHFEKMLYDNGSLLELYALEHGRTGEPEWERIVRETAAWIAREMTGPDGELWSAIDAETGGREGAFYVWTREQLESALGEEDAAFLAPLYGFAGAPFFEGDDYVLHLPAPLALQAEKRHSTREELLKEIAPLRQRLFDARAERPRPATDDKVLADWNGLAIRGLAVAGKVLEDGALLEMAESAARHVLTTMRPGGGGDGSGGDGSGGDGEGSGTLPGTLLHAVRGGEGRIEAYLSDYAFFVHGLLALHDATAADREEGGRESTEWLEAAVTLTREQVARLAHPEGGFYNAAPGPDLLFRSQEIFDGASPSANGIAVLNLLELAEALRETGADGEQWEPWIDLARQALTAFGPAVAKVPEAARTLSLANLRFHRMTGEGQLGEGHGVRVPAAEAADAADEGSEVDAPEVGVELQVDGPGEDGRRPFRLRLAVPDGWHLNAHPASAPFLLPTALEGESLDEVRYPEGRDEELAVGQGPLSVYSGRVELTGHLRPAVAGQEETLVLSYQPCDDRRCLPPVRRVVEVDSSKTMT